MKIYILTQDDVESSYIIDVFRTIGRAEKEKKKLEAQQLKDIKEQIKYEKKNIGSKYWLDELKKDLKHLKKYGYIDGGVSYNISEHIVK